MPSAALRMPEHVNLPMTAPMRILLVEDDPSDASLTEIVLDALKMDYALCTVQTGAEALAYLCRQGKYKEEPRPDMLLLDLSLPTKDGFEVLAELAEQGGRFAHLPIVILTGDIHCAFLTHSYGLNIAAYLTKPCSLVKLRNAFIAVRKSRNLS